MRHVEYTTKETANTATHIAVDAHIEEIEHPGAEQEKAFREGFAASSGIRPETAETGGSIDNTDMLDDTELTPVPDSIELENPGLADS